MSDSFDPYHLWLSVSPRNQPPNLYQLLGLELFEGNPVVVSYAADRQMAHVRTFQAGKHAADSQRLLNEIAAARVCLLDPARKQEYDDRLRDQGYTDPLDEPDPVEEADGTAFGEYVLLDHLGSGWMGQVFKAQHRKLGRTVAIKILSQEATKSPELVARFRQKVSILGQLRHENLIEAFDAGQANDVHYLIMEYVDGWDMLELLKEHGVLPIDHVIDYMTQAAAGLSAAHELGIYHRNVKPSNILIDKEGIIKVIGLGVARFSAQSALSEQGAAAAEIAEQQGRIVGTVDFMAPEQAINSSQADHRSDIYGLGCTMFTLLTKRMLYPVKGTSQKVAAHRSLPVPSLRSLRGDIPASLENVFQRMVAKSPAQRYQSMAEVVAVLEAIDASEIPPAQAVDIAPVEAIPVPAPTDSLPPGALPIPQKPGSQSPPAEEISGFLNKMAEEKPHWKKG